MAADETEEFEFRLRAEREGRGRSAAPARIDPTEGMSGLQKFAAGAGKAFVDIGRGVKQLSAMGPLNEEGRKRQQDIQAEIDESKRLDAPLMARGAGRAGNIAGNVAASIPLAAVPGANSLVGAAAIGGATGAVQPVASDESRGRNIAVGAAGGAAGQQIGKAVGAGLGYVADKLGRIRPATVATQAEKTMSQGYKLPPSYAEVQGAQPSRLAKWAEGFGGKIKTEQKFSIANQANTNRIVRKSLGLSDGDRIDGAELEQLRAKAGQVYESVKQYRGQFKSDREFETQLGKLARAQVPVSKAARGKLLEAPAEVRDLVARLRGDYNPEEAIAMVSKLREEWRGMRSSAVASERNLAKAYKGAADAIDGLIERNLSKDKNAAGLFKAYQQSRQVIAMTYDVERALNKSTGNVSAIRLANMLTRAEQGGRRSPMSGGIRQAAEFGQRAPGIAREVEKKGSRLGSEHSPLDFAVAALHPHTGVAMMARPVARAALASKSAQRSMLPASQQTLEQLLAPRAGELVGAQLLPAYGREQ